MIQEAKRYALMADGIRQILRQPAILDRSALLREHLESREARFLEYAAHCVFAQKNNPYRRMFSLADCRYSDLEASVHRHGLEATLRQLLEAGVYLTNEEFKGKHPIVRGGEEIAAGPGAFQRPRGEASVGSLDMVSSGSRSSGTRTPRSPQAELYTEVHTNLLYSEYDAADSCHVSILPVLPSSMGIGVALRAHRMGGRIERWFSEPGKAADGAAYRGLTQSMMWVARKAGADVPMPEYLPVNDYSLVARFLAEQTRNGRTYAVQGFTSPALRVAIAARDAGLDIAGTLFAVGGEAMTDAKRAVFDAAGCRICNTYITSEIGPIGYSCLHMRNGAVHIFEDAVEVISRKRRAPLSDQEVSALVVTTLLPNGGNFLINMETDDAGVVEPAECSCRFCEVGYHRQIRDLFSFGKLTGQGITLYGTDVVEMIERMLPAQFGGAPGDYQLTEQEGGTQSVIQLLVSPRVKGCDAAVVRDFFLARVRNQYGGALATRLWKHADAFSVEVREPVRTSTGKVLPLSLLGSGSGER